MNIKKTIKKTIAGTEKKFYTAQKRFMDRRLVHFQIIKYRKYLNNPDILTAEEKAELTLILAERATEK